MLVLDVEGFEPAVVKGATRTLGDPRLKVVVAETLGLAADYGLDDKAMHQTMLGYGFQTCHYDPFRRRLNVTNGMDPVNTVYVRDLAAVQKRVVAAPSFEADGHAF